MSVRLFNGNAIAFGGKAQMVDATEVAQLSPLAVETTIVALAVPGKAVAVNLSTLQNSLRVGVDADHSDGYALLPAGTVHRLPCADEQPIYVRTEGGADEISFWFEIE